MTAEQMAKRYADNLLVLSEVEAECAVEDFLAGYNAALSLSDPNEDLKQQVNFLIGQVREILKLAQEQGEGWSAHMASYTLKALGEQDSN